MHVGMHQNPASWSVGLPFVLEVKEALRVQGLRRFGAYDGLESAIKWAGILDSSAARPAAFA